MFKIATYNVNSVRMRLPIVLDWMARHSPDAVCLQETKVRDEEFPRAEIEAAGYKVAFKGQKGYNGVAIISPHEIENVSFGIRDGADPDDARILRAVVRDVNVVTTYVPQGVAVDAPNYLYKLQWFKRLRRLFEAYYKPTDYLVWTGDLNVAPEDIDVYDPKRLANAVCFTPEEKHALSEAMAWGFVDVFRMHNKEAGQYTFWDYRVIRATSRNIGWRLDHIMATKPLAARSTASYIDKAPRMAEKPSDHTVLVAEFDV